MMFENHKICQELMISYICGGYGKNLRMFRTIRHVRSLETETSIGKIRRIRTEVVRYGVLVQFEFEFEFKNFSISYMQHKSCRELCSRSDIQIHMAVGRAKEFPQVSHTVEVLIRVQNFLPSPHHTSNCCLATSSVGPDLKLPLTC